MKKLLIMSVVLIAIIMVVILPAASAMASAIHPIEYMPADSHYYVFSQFGELLLLDTDLHTVPLKHIPYYLPPYSRCVIIKDDNTMIVLYAVPPGRYVIPPLYPPATPF